MARKATKVDDSGRTDAATLRRRIRTALEAEADPARAVQAQRYMKSAMPFLGVPVPKVRALSKQLFAGTTFADAETWRRTVRALWDGAEFREERYATIQLVRHAASRPFLDVDALPTLEHLVVTGAWWDLVDELAHVFGDLLQAHPKPIARVMRQWSTSDDLWKRRTSIICQLQFGTGTDFALLTDCIAPSLGSKEFFLRKAIGWALRDYAWRDPATVLRYVDAHRAQLSPLSVREALKNVRPDGTVPRVVKSSRVSKPRAR